MSHQFQKNGIKILSVRTFLFVAGLVLGANFIFHASDHPSQPVVFEEDSASSDSKISADGEERKSTQPTRNIASVGTAARITAQAGGNPLLHRDMFSAIGVDSKNTAQPQTLWNNTEGNPPAPSNTESPTNSALSKNPSQDSGVPIGPGATGSGITAAAPAAPAAIAAATAITATIAEDTFLESGGHLSSATSSSAGFAVVSGGSVGTGTGMQVDASIGQVTSPNVQNGTGITLVSGLAGPVMVNF